VFKKKLPGTLSVKNDEQFITNAQENLSYAIPKFCSLKQNLYAMHAVTIFVAIGNSVLHEFLREDVNPC
jgi:hypothetical protein